MLVNIENGFESNWEVRLYRPDGQLMRNLLLFNTGEAFEVADLPETGIYTIVIRADSGFSYDITAVVIDQVPEFGNVELMSGQLTNATIFSGNIDTFTITARAGNDLFVKIENTVRISGWEARLYDPEGQLLSAPLIFTDGGDFEISDLPQSGTYTITMRNPTPSGGGGGFYQITAAVIDDVLEASNVELISGRLTNSDIDFGDIDTFTIAAGAGDDLLVNIQNDNNNGNREARLYGPDGNLVGEAVIFTTGGILDVSSLTLSGVYTIVVRNSCLLYTSPSPRDRG